MEKSEKIEILLQQQKIASDQMSAIKHDELVWLKLFFIFCGAILSWEISFWLKPEIFEFVENQLKNLGFATFMFTSFVTIIFSYLFLKIRWSYYDASQRLRKAEILLKLYDPEIWKPELPFKDYYNLESEMGYKNWKKQTKPFATFRYRMVFLLSANLVVVIVSLYILPWIDINRKLIIAGLFFLFSYLLYEIIFIIDRNHFKNFANRLKQERMN